MNQADLVPKINTQSTRSICFILNDRAVLNQDLQEEIQKLKDNRCPVETREITQPGEAISLARTAAQEGFDVIVAAGGDGTLNEVVNGAMQSGRIDEIALGVIPAGTANDFAMQCNLTPDHIPEILTLLTQGPAVLIDVGKVNNRYFINLASGGYGAEITTETPTEIKHLLGGFAYFITGVASIMNLSAKEAHILTPDLDWKGALLAFTVGNGRQAGGGIQACPKALLNDGLFDVLIIPEVPPEDLILLIRDLIRLGKHVDYQYIQYVKTPFLKIVSDQGLQVNLDGEPLIENEFHFEILPKKIPFLLPPNPLLNEWAC